MRIKDLHIRFYKNLKEIRWPLNEGIHYITGPNGIGKTNLLDSLYFLATGKSYFTPKSLYDVIHYDSDFMRIQWQSHIEEQWVPFVIKLTRGQSLSIERYGKPFDRRVDYVGTHPVVLIAPDDIYNFKHSAAERRRWIDAALSMMDVQYLTKLRQHNRLLRQRNALLRRAEHASEDVYRLLDAYDEQLWPLVRYIFEQRQCYLHALIPHIQSYYRRISSQAERVDVQYQSEVDVDDYLQNMSQRREEDLRFQRTGYGIHRDDIYCTIDTRPMKGNASQGQWKSFILAFKMAQYRYMAHSVGHLPLLLIDDIFAKLDRNRVHALFEILQTDSFGQVFITDTDKERMQELLIDFGASNMEGYDMKEGTLMPVSQL